jgi:hypothetical protein
MRLTSLALFALSVGGCRAAAHRGGPPRIPAEQVERYWNNCEEMVDARAIGWQRFACTNLKGKRYDVWVRAATN